MAILEVSITYWLLYAATALAASALAVWLYRRREPPTRGRWLGAGLRAASLSLALLLLFDPWLPDPAAAGGRRLVVLDDSYSMLLPVAPGDTTTRWAAALRAVDDAGADAVLRLGGGRDASGGDATGGGSTGGDATRDASGEAPGAAPNAPVSRAASALRAAAEAGARGVTLITDAALEDAASAAAVAADAGLAVETVVVAAEPVANAAVAALDAPARARAGDTITVRVELAAMNVDADSATVVVESDGAEVGRRTLAVPAAGRRAGVEVRVALAAGPERIVRLEARLDGWSDAFPSDNWRPAFVEVGEAPRGVVLLSLRPDWEPRFLVPTLATALGLPVDAFARAPASGWYRIGGGAGAGGAGTVPEARVREMASGASLLVLHGLDARAPAWARELAARPRVLVLSSEAGPAAGNTLAGEWYPEPAPPASPVAPLLAGLPWQELPPIVAPADLDARGAWVGLAARRDRRGDAEPLVVGRATDGGRQVVVTGSGWYRWALRGGEARRAYRALWSSLAGWLVEGMGAVDVRALRPERAVVDRGEDVVWLAAPGADSVRLTLETAAGEPVLDTVLVPQSGRARQNAPPPGEYVYRATVYGAAEQPLEATGALAVAAYSDELVRPSAELPFDDGDGDAVLTAGRQRLHTTAWPWILLVALLCAEWIVRRRQGLR